MTKDAKAVEQLDVPSAQWRAVVRGYKSKFSWPSETVDTTQRPASNALREFFDSRKQGRGIWKWNHYFDIYDRHFHRFRGQEVHILEIGIYSGGSMEMWRDYFGPKADIEPGCRAYESDTVKIFIGDQADRMFWHDFRQKVPVLDIVIDDGGHQPEQQVVSVEELLPHLRPGGVYCCEDVHGEMNQFASYVHGLSHQLNRAQWQRQASQDDEHRLVCNCTPFQAGVNSIHLYPFVTVLERNSVPVTELRAPKRGTQWQPFMK